MFKARENRKRELVESHTPDRVEDQLKLLAVCEEIR